MSLNTVRHYSRNAMKPSRSPQAIVIYSYIVVRTVDSPAYRYPD